MCHLRPHLHAFSTFEVACSLRNSDLGWQRSARHALHDGPRPCWPPGRLAAWPPHIAMCGLVITIATLLVLADVLPARAQPASAPTNCTESMTIGAIFIGHDCGEWASVVISGRVVLRKPWSRVNRASRAARLRARREAGLGVTVTPTPPASGSITLYGIDVSGGTNPTDLDCDDFEFREDAEELWAAQGWSTANDPHQLDGNGDGQPCEDLPTRKG